MGKNLLRFGKRIRPRRFNFIGANLPHLYLADVTIDAKDNLCSIIQFPKKSS